MEEFSETWEIGSTGEKRWWWLVRSPEGVVEFWVCGSRLSLGAVVSAFPMF
jgi:hypothetical protein